MKAICKSLAHDQSGLAVLEFAIVAPALIALILASLETSLVFFAQEALETDVEASARGIITGQTQANDSTGAGAGMTQAQLQTRFQQAACAKLPIFMKCANLYVDVRSAPSWTNLNTSMPTLSYDGNGNVTNQFGYTLGNSGSIVLVRLMYLWPVQAGPLGFNLANATPNKRLIVGTAVAKIENYTA